MDNLVTPTNSFTQHVKVLPKSSCKYILVTGGVISGLGKGVVASSTGRILRSYGFNVTAIKIDPYINIDAGTMSPFEHGEVFVLGDGGEVDLDLGNYERFLDIDLTKDHNITTGKIYDQVIRQERKGEFLGHTVQVIPHISDAIQNWISKVSAVKTDPKYSTPPNICIIELGGTIGDIESMPFVEAMRQFQFLVGHSNFCVVHVSLIPVIGVVGEQKTKPTQQSVRQLRLLGLAPDIIICRSSEELSDSTRVKVSNFCNVGLNSVIGIHDVSNIYRVADILSQQNLIGILQHCLDIPSRLPLKQEFDKWHALAETVEKLNNSTDPSMETNIVVIGKYTGLMDSYLSVVRALQHASYALGRKLKVEWVEASHLESESNARYHESWAHVRNADGILVPGGFGDRGIEGKVLAAKYARENRKPFLGICLGMQIAIIEAARSVLGWTNANSTEFDANTPMPVVIYMPEISKTVIGGTMRLGKRRTYFSNQKSVSYLLYKALVHPIQIEQGIVDPKEPFQWVDERHRHRYEVNPAMVQDMIKAGIQFVGHDQSGQRQEIVEVPNHPFFMAVQYHPEFLSRPNKPSPPFFGFILAASGKLESWLVDHGA